ncbi:MAG: ribonuclease H-like domain-containing protein [Desulfobulbaceae bacterium]|nr:ribonuclease H-like domain-containing protein [Desulfobulbaceae bacterium]
MQSATVWRCSFAPVTLALCLRKPQIMNNRFDIEFVKYEFAKYSFRECLNFLDLHRQLHTYVQDNLSFGTMVSTAFVVTYARPFSKSNREYHGMSMGAISTKWLKELSQSQKNNKGVKSAVDFSGPKKANQKPKADLTPFPPDQSS